MFSYMLSAPHTIFAGGGLLLGFMARRVHDGFTIPTSAWVLQLHSCVLLRMCKVMKGTSSFHAGHGLGS